MCISLRLPLISRVTNSRFCVTNRVLRVTNSPLRVTNRHSCRSHFRGNDGLSQKNLLSAKRQYIIFLQSSDYNIAWKRGFKDYGGGNFGFCANKGYRFKETA